MEELAARNTLDIEFNDQKLVKKLACLYDEFFKKINNSSGNMDALLLEDDGGKLA